MTKTRDNIELCLLASVAAVLSSGFVIYLNRARSAPAYPQPHAVAARPADVIGTRSDAPQPAAQPYTLVEYMDYQCPPCRRLEPALEAFAAGHAAKLRVITRNFPLPMHPNAYPAAVFAEAAREQGHFPDVHAALLKSKALDSASLRAIAAQHKLDLPRLNHAMQTTAKDVVLADVGRANGISVHATPTLFLCCPDNKVVQVYDVKQLANYVR